MARKTDKKKIIKIKKATINKIEKWIAITSILIIIVIIISTRPMSTEKAAKIAKEKYMQVEQVLSKVLTGTDWLNLSKECIEQDGYKFCKSNSEGLLEYDDLRDYINTVCTKEFTNDILKEKEVVYKDIDGDLYVLASNRNTDVFYARS